MGSNDYNPKISNTIIESDALYKIKELCEKINCGKSILLVYDNNTKKIAGDTLYSELSSDYKVETYTISDADIENVQIVRDIIEKNKISLVIPVGGGRPLDVGKLASYKENIPWISVPTACSHDGIASGRASITDNGNKVSKLAHAPIGVLADTKIIANSPQETYTAGLGDIISNITAVADWYVSHKMTGEEVNDEAAVESILVASYIIDSADDLKVKTENSVREVMYNLIKSGKAMQMAGSSRPASGLEHKISHALDRILDEPKMHGHQCGLGTLFSAAVHEKYDKPCKYSFEEIDKAFKILKIPKTFEETGIPRNKFMEAFYMTPEISDRYTIADAVDINVEVILDEIGL